MASEVGAAAGAVRSAPLRAPRRFSLVGLRWRGRAEPRIAVRVRREGRGWSRWVRLDSHAEHRPDQATAERSAQGASSPLWVGAADWVQYRSSRHLPGLRLHFVKVRGTAPAARAAQEPQPGIVPRADWGASQCPPRQAPDYGEVKAAYVHHTVSVNDYSPEEAPGIVLAICRYHRNSNGWGASARPSWARRRRASTPRPPASPTSATTPPWHRRPRRSLRWRASSAGSCPCTEPPRPGG